MHQLNTKLTHLKNVAGIYKITTKTNNKSYIGSSVNLYQRLQRHKRDLLNQKHCNIYLQRVFDKYGIDEFVYEILEQVDINTIYIREQYYINLYDTANHDIGYNLCPVAGSRLGSRHSSSTLEKLSKARQNYQHSDETKQKISDANKGKTLTLEQKQKLSLSLKQHYLENPNHFLGKTHTEDTLEKMREAKLGNKASDETKLKMSINNTGSSNPSAKLVEADVLEIRLLHSSKSHTVQEIADLFGVKKGTVENILYRRTWKNI